TASELPAGFTLLLNAVTESASIHVPVVTKSQVRMGARGNAMQLAPHHRTAAALSVAALLIASFARGSVDATAAVTPGWTITNLHTGGSVRDINERGWVVGSRKFCTRCHAHAFLWRAGQVTDLGTLGGAEESSRAVAVNDRGQVLGESYALGANTSTSFVWE